MMRVGIAVQTGFVKKKEGVPDKASDDSIASGIRGIVTNFALVNI